MKPWLFYALLSAVSAAFVSIFGKMGLAGLDSNAATAVRAVIMAAFLVGVVAVEGHGAGVAAVFADRRALLWIALSGIAGALSWLFYFLALKYGKVSEVAPIDKLSVVFAVLLAGVLFGERVSALHAVAIGLIAAGGLMLAVF
ncbi:MAG: EamA family transporter [Selenomonas sp.]|nr:EamA family transporter [Selenomonas sp.]